jgi:hypothetical protein
MLERDTATSISICGNGRLDADRDLRAGCSNSADAVRPGRDTEPVCCAGRSPRAEPIDGSSLLFTVRSFPLSVECGTQYYDLG